MKTVQQFKNCRNSTVSFQRWKSSLQQPRQVIVTNNVIRSPFTDVTIPEMSLNEYVWRNMDRWKYWPALTCAMTGRSYTYTEARDASERLSLSLPASTGLRSGDTVALVMPNAPEFPLTVLACAAAGLVVSPANPLYTPDELARQFSDSNSKVVVTVPLLLDKVRAAVDLVPGGAEIVVATDGSSQQEAQLQASGLVSLQKLLAQEVSRHTLRLPRPDPDSLVALPYSSGTTGLPKGVCITHRNLVANLCQMEHPHVSNTPIEGFQDIALAVLPFFHIYGLNGVMNINLCIGRHTVTVPRFDANMFAKVFTCYKPTVMSVVPPLLLFLGSTKDIATSDLSRVRFVTCGAAPATPALIEQFIKRTNNDKLDFREGYGMTETSCLGLITPSWTRLGKIGSCGVPVPLTEIKIVNDAGEALPLGREGELWIRGPQVMKSYHNNLEASQDTLMEDGWLKTGDVAYVDDDGYVFLVDRIKELIKVKGLQVSPTELEGTLRQMEGVADVAVIGVPDERAGELPRAFVVRRGEISEADVETFIEARLAPFKWLAGGVQFVNEIPKNAAGKILRKKLKEMCC